MLTHAPGPPRTPEERERLLLKGRRKVAKLKQQRQQKLQIQTPTPPLPGDATPLPTPNSLFASPTPGYGHTKIPHPLPPAAVENKQRNAGMAASTVLGMVTSCDAMGRVIVQDGLGRAHAQAARSWKDEDSWAGCWHHSLQL